MLHWALHLLYGMIRQLADRDIDVTIVLDSPSKLGGDREDVVMAMDTIFKLVQLPGHVVKVLVMNALRESDEMIPNDQLATHALLEWPAPPPDLELWQGMMGCILGSRVLSRRCCHKPADLQGGPDVVNCPFC
jgi:hypothetical protein